MELDIVFNIDYPSENGVGLLYSEIPKYIRFLQVSDFTQFKRLVSALSDDVKCFIWVHPSLSAKRVQDGYKSLVISESVPELNTFSIKFTEITRSTGQPQYANVDTMLDLKKTMQRYTAGELKKMLTIPVLQPARQEPRQRLKESFKSETKNINERLKVLRVFFNQCAQEKGMWYSHIFELNESAVDGIFGFPYWAFPQSIYQNYLNLGNIDQPIIHEDELHENNTIRFNQETKQWHIDISFFDDVSFRFEGQTAEYSDKLAIATCLYVLHEAIHKIHNLDCNTVQGIGNFPKIIEEADYQADSIAILSEFAFQINTAGGLGKLNDTTLINLLCGIIEIAIETTFSFNPIEEELKQIQVRRVNRYLIWFYHYFKLKNYLKNGLATTDLLEKILAQFSSKPLIEITGPSIRSNRDQNRTFYDLGNIKHLEEVAVLKINNEIVRMGKTGSIDFSHLYDGMKKSNFSSMYEFMNVLFSSNQHALL